MKKNNYLIEIDISQGETKRAKVTIHAKDIPLPPSLDFPVWTPGSYLVREYSRHITLLHPGEKREKNRWYIGTNTKKVSYEVYCNEKTVRTSYIEENYAVLVGATLLPFLPGSFTVTLKVSPETKFVQSALNFKKTKKNIWTANVRDYDQWVDCPIVTAISDHGEIQKFKIHGITHHIAWVGTACNKPMGDITEAFKKIAQQTIRMFGGAPFKEYWFLLHFGQKHYGGLEHRNSQLSQFDGSLLHEKKLWDGFLRLIAHEYFHSWNVKSIRPKALGPFNYFAENYTQDIWFAEGLTDYFDDLIPLACGFIDSKAYWESRIKDANLLTDGLPAHSRRSLADTSFDAWIRYYRPDEDSINTDVSYYSKGALLGWCWDAHLQKSSKRKWSLEKLMKEIWKEFGVDESETLQKAQPGFTRTQLLSFAEAKTKIKQKSLVEDWVTAKKPLPWKNAAKYFGVEIKETVKDLFFHSTGIVLQQKEGLRAHKVLSNSAAEQAAIAPGDEILAINNVRITDIENAQKAIDAIKEAKEFSLLISRTGRIYIKSLRIKKHKEVGVEYTLDLQKSTIR
ncbi:MAG: PDZ domain-containing protein [Oligoflexia bacterium]|nr:PDZ domain-containing protein [Oligoflexia bacterium]